MGNKLINTLTCCLGMYYSYIWRDNEYNHFVKFLFSGCNMPFTLHCRGLGGQRSECQLNHFYKIQCVQGSVEQQKQVRSQPGCWDVALC